MSMNKSLKLICLSAALSLAAPAATAQYVAPVEPQVIAKLEAWKDLKFGVIFHWGLYSQAGICESWPICSEDEDWIPRDSTVRYDDYKRWYWERAEEFNPVKFDPAQWASVMKDAGMKYMVFTTKHHDGFCMFDTHQTDFSINHYALKGQEGRDITREVLDAFRSEGLWVGTYFSKPDWHCQDYWWDRYATPNRHVNYDISRHPYKWEAYKDFTFNQISELMHGYGPVDILWLDGGWVATGTREDVDMDRIGAMAREAQPSLLVVDRTVGGKWENYCTPEQNIPDSQLPYPWESCVTLSKDWGYVPGAKFKPASAVIGLLAEITAKGGSLLLGVGPDPSGLIEPAVADTLAKVGAWLDRNGGAIYGTRPLQDFHEDLDGTGDIWFTSSKDGAKAYLIAVPQEGGEVPSRLRWTVNIPASKASSASVTVLSTGRKLRCRIVDGVATVILPAGIDRNEAVALEYSRH